MLAVLITICFSLRQTMSTHDTQPRRIASTVLAAVSQPMSLAKWLNVPAGKTASGMPASIATPAATATVPSPPPIREHLGPLRGRPDRLVEVVALAELDDLGLRKGGLAPRPAPGRRSRCPRPG